MTESSEEFPRVNILVPARNEQINLKKCLNSLIGQDYSGGFEILFIDDGSDDQSLQIAKEIAGEYSGLRVFEVDTWKFAHLPGKQRALAQLGFFVNGEILLFCDADMELPSSWVKEMVKGLQYFRADLLNGTTMPSYHSWFHAMQALDWLLAQSAMGFASRMGMPYTAMGNNMAITRLAYESTGGYSAIHPSITEDYELFSAANKMGFKLIHWFNPCVLGKTKPAATLSQWHHQHIRWLSGFRQLPFFKKLPVYVNLILLPVLAGAVMLEGSLFRYLLSLFLAKIIFQIFSLLQIRQYRLLLYLPVYELLYPFFYGFLIASGFFRKKVIWKGRNFPLPVG